MHRPCAVAAGGYLAAASIYFVYNSNIYVYSRVYVLARQQIYLFL